MSGAVFFFLHPAPISRTSAAAIAANRNDLDISPPYFDIEAYLAAVPAPEANRAMKACRTAESNAYI